MRIRLKLLILLLVIALLPLIAVTWYDMRAVLRLGADLSARAQAMLTERAEENLLLAVRGSAAVLARERQLAEAGLALQARAVEDALAAAAPPAPQVIAQELAAVRERTGLAGVGQAVFLMPDLVFAGPSGQADRVAGPPAWADLAMRTGGTVALAPGAAGAAADPGVAFATPVRGPAGDTAGATAIMLSLAALMEGVTEPAVRPARVLLVAPAGGDHGPAGLRVVAERASDGAAPGNNGFIPAGGRAGAASAVDDMAAGGSAVRVVGGPDGELWAYAPVPGLGAHLLFVVPYGDIAAAAAVTEGQVMERLGELRLVMWIGLAALVPVLVGVSLFASRAVTLPVRQLAEAARRLAAGDFGARTRIRSGDELEELGKLFNVMVPQLDHSMRMRDSLALAQEVQRNLLPGEPPRIPGFDIAGLSVYCDETGGDYYDFFPLPELGAGHVGVAIGDVAGHGIAAALLMTTVRASLRAREMRPGRLADLVTEVNRQLAGDTHAGRFMTLFLALLDADARRVHWVGAGHTPGIIYDPATDTIQEIAGPDIPLGIDPDWRYSELDHQGWSPGTVLVLGTDGIWEARDDEGRAFERHTGHRLVRENHHRSAAEIASVLTGALERFRHGRPPEDDVTLVVVKAVG